MTTQIARINDVLTLIEAAVDAGSTDDAQAGAERLVPEVSALKARPVQLWTRAEVLGGVLPTTITEADDEKALRRLAYLHDAEEQGKARKTVLAHFYDLASVIEGNLCRAGLRNATSAEDISQVRIRVQASPWLNKTAAAEIMAACTEAEGAAAFVAAHVGDAPDADDADRKRLFSHLGIATLKEELILDRIADCGPNQVDMLREALDGSDLQLRRSRHPNIAARVEKAIRARLDVLTRPAGMPDWPVTDFDEDSTTRTDGSTVGIDDEPEHTYGNVCDELRRILATSGQPALVAFLQGLPDGGEAALCTEVEQAGPMVDGWARGDYATVAKAADDAGLAQLAAMCHALEETEALDDAADALDADLDGTLGELLADNSAAELAATAAAEARAAGVLALRSAIRGNDFDGVATALRTLLDDSKMDDDPLLYGFGEAVRQMRAALTEARDARPVRTKSARPSAQRELSATVITTGKLMWAEAVPQDDGTRVLTQADRAAIAERTGLAASWVSNRGAWSKSNHVGRSVRLAAEGFVMSTKGQPDGTWDAIFTPVGS